MSFKKWSGGDEMSKGSEKEREIGKCIAACSHLENYCLNINFAHRLWSRWYFHPHTYLCDSSITCGYFSLEKHLCSWLNWWYQVFERGQKQKRQSEICLSRAQEKNCEKPTPPKATFCRISNWCNVFSLVLIFSLHSYKTLW